MTSTFAFTKIFRSEKGQVTMGLFALVIITAAIVAILQFKDRFSSEGMTRIDNIKVPVSVRSGIETMIAAYRQAEVEYIKKVVELNCISANTFLDAMDHGTQCKASDPNYTHSDFDVFVSPLAPGVMDELYNYAGDCTIGMNTGCVSATQRPKVIEIGVPHLLSTPSHAIGGLQFTFSLMRIDTKLKTLTIKAEVVKKDKAKKVFEIQFRDSNSNMAHMDADGFVRQSNPDPNDFCKGNLPEEREPYSKLKIFDETEFNCKEFSQIGGGTGLTYYRGRYFSFRPADGQVFDLKESANNTSNYYSVREDGTLDGITKVFPEYSKEVLFNADDMTIIEDQIYYVKGQITNVAIYAYVNSTLSKKVCDLGLMGWGQAYVGLSSKAWSDKLVPDAPSTDSKMATFYLKTFSGDLLTVLAWTTGMQSPNPEFECIVLKDAANQEDENKRTYGFDKVVTDKSFIYW